MTTPSEISRAARVLHHGGVVAYPTDTLYGLAVDPRSDEAVERLFALKGRLEGHAVPIIAADAAQAADAAVFTDAAQRVAAALWPGPLALVLDARERLSAGILATDGSVAVRVPAHPVARALAEAFGFCITATSANLTGEEPTASVRMVSASLGKIVDLVLDGGDSPGGPPSTIVDLRGVAPRLVRGGAVPWDRVLRSIQ
jgi:L-threonylcarbamoyladenylate synthase